MSSLKFNHDDDEEKLMAKALYVGKVEEEDDDSEVDLWGNAYKDGHDFIRRQIKERNKIPAISTAHNIPNQKKAVAKSSGGLSRSKVSLPPGCFPCPAWQKDQVKEFSNIRLQLSQHMSLIKASKEQAVKIPDKRNEALWCHLCFGSNIWKLVEETKEEESDNELVKGGGPGGVKEVVEGQKPGGVKEVVEGQKPLLSMISCMPNHYVEAVLEFQVSWLRKVGWFSSLGPWLYALLARLEKPLTPDTSSLIRSLALQAARERARMAASRTDTEGASSTEGTERASRTEGTEGHPGIAACNLFVCLISQYFGQGDLADREEEEN